MRLKSATFWTVLCALGAGQGCHVAIGLGDYQESGGAGGTVSTGGAGGDTSGAGGEGGAGGITDFNPNWDGRIALDVTTANTSELSSVFIPLTLDVPSAAHDLLADPIGGADFAVTLGGSTQILQTDVESYDGSRLVVWVEMPVLPVSPDAFRLYLYVGNDTAPAPIWPYHEGVYHLSLRPGLGQRRADHSGNSRNTSPRIGTNDIAGVVGTGMNFPDITSRVPIPYMNEFAFDAATFTVSAWIKDPMDVMTDHQCAVFNGGTRTNGTPRAGYALGLGGSLQTEFFYSDGNTPFDGSLGSSGSGWQQLVAVVDRTADEVHLYRDGVLQKTQPIPDHGATASGIAPSLSDTSCPYRGELDEVRFVSRALPAATIKGNYEVIKTPPVVQVVGDLEMAL